MTKTAEHNRNFRKSRHKKGLCESCKRPTIEGQRLCPKHRDLHRLRNRRYEQSLRDQGKKTPAAIVYQRLRQTRKGHMANLVAWAKETGRVPTLKVCAEIMGHTEWQATYVQQIRLAAFGLRPRQKHESRAVISYPVPDEWRA